MKAKQLKSKQGPKLLPTKKAAEHLGISVGKLKTLTWNNHVKFVKYPDSRRYYYLVKDLDHFIEMNRGYFD